MRQRAMLKITSLTHPLNRIYTLFTVGIGFGVAASPTKLRSTVQPSSVSSSTRPSDAVRQQPLNVKSGAS
jgi:hypothetical protein